MNGKKLLLVPFFFLFWFATQAQSLSPNLIPFTPGSYLTWQDFQGTVDVHNKYSALARAGINFSYNASNREGAFRLTFQIKSYFDKSQSWGKPDKQTPYLLSHEQLHFDIAELHARKLRQVFDTYKFTDNYKTEIKTLFTATMQELQKMQIAYDTESDHSLNKEKQQMWQTFIKQELLKYETTARAN